MYDEDSQPKYNAKEPISKHRHNVYAYKQYTPELREAQTKEHALATMTKDNFLESQEWQNFVKLMGKEEAIRWFKAGLYQATQ